MKIFKILSILISLNVLLLADVFDGVDKAKKPILYPVLKKEYRKFVPLIPRVLSSEELEAKRAEDAMLQKEANKTFIKKEQIKQIKKLKTKINTSSGESVH